MFYFEHKSKKKTLIFFDFYKTLIYNVL